MSRRCSSAIRSASASTPKRSGCAQRTEAEQIPTNVSSVDVVVPRPGRAATVRRTLGAKDAQQLATVINDCLWRMSGMFSCPMDTGGVRHAHLPCRLARRDRCASTRPAARASRRGQRAELPGLDRRRQGQQLADEDARPAERTTACARELTPRTGALSRDCRRRPSCTSGADATDRGTPSRTLRWRTARRRPARSPRAADAPPARTDR